jgi:Zn-dependent protease with chaperone function
MSGKLEPEEWAPLIASSLIFNEKIEPKLKRKFLTRLVLPAIVPLLVFPLSYFVADQIIRLIYLVVSGVVLVFILRSYMPYLKRGKLAADLEAASLVGKDAFSRVLMKIDSMKLSDIETLKKGGRKAAQFADRPSVTERLAT